MKKGCCVWPKGAKRRSTCSRDLLRIHSDSPTYSSEPTRERPKRARTQIYITGEAHIRSQPSRQGSVPILLKGKLERLVAQERSHNSQRLPASRKSNSTAECRIGFDLYTRKRSSETTSRAAIQAAVIRGLSATLVPSQSRGRSTMSRARRRASRSTRSLGLKVPPVSMLRAFAVDLSFFQTFELVRSPATSWLNLRW